MISEAYLNIQVEKSKSAKFTSPFLRTLIFQIVDSALTEHYGKNYSTCCLQSSAAINQLLKRFGISSRIITGAFCTIEVYKQKNKIGWEWGGFWDKDHHIFVISENSDLIDLTISQLHLHPQSNKKKYLPILPIWWSPISKWPPLIKYIPEKTVEIELSEAEMNDLHLFLDKVNKLADSYLLNKEVEDIRFVPFLSGIESLNKYTLEGNEWLKWAKEIIIKGVAFPEWIIKKEYELLNSFSRK